MDEEKNLSEQGQKLWDAFGEAQERHFADLDTHIERETAAREYLSACRALYEYIADLEEKASKYDGLAK